MKNSTARNALIVLSLGLSFLVSIGSHAMSEEDIIERIKPAAKVCVEGDANCGSGGAASSGPKSGEDVYNTSCMACHSTGAAGAPKLGDKAAWADRLSKGLDTVYANAINGVGGMPPKGTCMNCSDDELKAAVDHILGQSK